MNAAKESKEAVEEAVHGVDMIFVMARMAVGTGTNRALVIAGIAKSMGILTVGIVTTPLSCEGRRRSTPVTEAFNLADDILQQGIRGFLI
ncbi:hypothetical protein Ancab_014370 [Ancistrocladus abbreviatus]